MIMMMMMDFSRFFLGVIIRVLMMMMDLDLRIKDLD